MAKSLGQIHNCSVQRTQIQTGDTGPQARIDLPGILTQDLQRLIRQGCYFKVVGIDMSMDLITPAAANSGRVTGHFRFYRPTKGRCAAYRHAFKSMADLMTTQGIPMRQNKLYDFRVALNDNAFLTANIPLKNQATLDGTNGLALNASGTPGASVFDVYNKSVLPTTQLVPDQQLFDEGFDTILQSGVTKTDFVLNDDNLYSGNEDFASKTYETIPFQLAWGQSNTTATFQFRPDPALFIAILAGQLEVVIDDAVGIGSNINLDIDVMVAGWKSIMGNPSSKKSSSKKTRK